jgi:hypothetical protein
VCVCVCVSYVFNGRYALLSSPKESCNPTADTINGAQDGGVIVVSFITLVILCYCVMNGTRILNIFNPDVSIIFDYNN